MSDPVLPPTPLIGRERELIDNLAKLIHKEVSRHHNYGSIYPGRRGSSFEVQILLDGKPTGRIARVTVELDRVESTPEEGKN